MPAGHAPSLSRRSMMLRISARVSPHGLRHGDEAQAGQQFVVDVVAVGAAFGVGQQALALVEPDGLGGHPGRVGYLTDQHFARPPLDLLPQYKV